MERASTLERKPFLLAWFICLLLMEFFGAGVSSGPVYKQFDYRAFYSAGYLARTHPSQLYDLAKQEQVQDALVSPRKNVLAFYHPSYETLLYAPFSMLPYRASYLVFLTFNMVLLLAALFVARPAFISPDPALRSRRWFLFLLYLPALVAIAMGQDSILLLLLCCIAWRQLESGKDLSAGCVLALALFKFQLVIPIAILIAVRRGWRFSSGFLLASSGVALLCLGIGGPGGMTNYVRLLSGASSAIDRSVVAQQRLSVFPLAMPNLAGLLYACGARLLGSPFAFDMLSGACALVLFVWCACIVRQREQKVAFSIAILCGLLVSYHLYVYDLAPLLLAIALLAGRVRLYVLLGLFLLPLVLLPFGSNSFFLLSLPVLAMLADLMFYAPHPAVADPAPQRAAAV